MVSREDPIVAVQQQKYVIFTENIVITINYAAKYVGQSVPWTF